MSSPPETLPCVREDELNQICEPAPLSRPGSVGRSGCTFKCSVQLFISEVGVPQHSYPGHPVCTARERPGEARVLPGFRIRVGASWSRDVLEGYLAAAEARTVSSDGPSPVFTGRHLEVWLVQLSGSVGQRFWEPEGCRLSIHSSFSKPD